MILKIRFAASHTTFHVADNAVGGSGWGEGCQEHDHGVMVPQVVSTYLAHTVGGAPHLPVVFTETQVRMQLLFVSRRLRFFVIADVYMYVCMDR